MTEQEKQNQITEARQLYVAAPILIPMIDRMATSAYQRLIAGFRNGEKNRTAIIAELSVLENMKRTITSKMEILNEPKEKKL